MYSYLYAGLIAMPRGVSTIVMSFFFISTILLFLALFLIIKLAAQSSKKELD